MNNRERKLWKKVNQILFLYLLLIEIFLIGWSMNRLATSNNYGRMPVYLNSYNFGETWEISYFQDKTHFTYKNFSEVNYPLFTDIIPTSLAVYSIGDLLVYFSFFLFEITCIYNICFLIETLPY